MKRGWNPFGQRFARTAGAPAAAPVSALRSRWRLLAVRERVALALAASVVTLALLWATALAPALKVLREAPAQHRLLDARLQAMQQMAAQAEPLKNQPRLSTEEALGALEAATQQRLGASGQVTVAGERATVTLKNARPEALAQWLMQVRTNARMSPAEMRLVRNLARTSAAAGGPAAATPPAPAPVAQPAALSATAGATWDGTVVLNLPARS